MAKLSIKAGTTSKLLDLFILNSTQSNGAGLNTLLYSSSGLSCYYYREGAASSVAVTLTNMTLGTYTAGGFIAIDTANMNGCYQLGIPNAAIDTAAKSVIVFLKGAANMVQTPLEIELTTTDNQDAVAGGMSRLDANVTSRLAAASTAANFSAISINAAGRIDVGNYQGVTAVTDSTTSRPDVNLTFVRGSSINSLISGRVDANSQVVGDKTGYSLSQTFPTNFSSLSIDGNGRVIVGGSTSILKNVAISNFPFMLIDSSDHISPRTSATINAQRSIDGGNFGATSNTATEVGNGWYKINLSASDLNGTTIALRFTGTGCDVTNIGITTNVP